LYYVSPLCILRLSCKRIQVQSGPLKFDDGKYHHLAVAYDDGEVNFYLDGKPAGQAWLPGGEPVRLERNLLVGEDASMGTDEQLQGQVDDVLVLGRAMQAEEIAALARRGSDGVLRSSTVVPLPRRPFGADRGLGGRASRPPSKKRKVSNRERKTGQVGL
jgi:hypothetical protein